MTRIGGGGPKPPPDTSEAVKQAQTQSGQTKQATGKSADKTAGQNKVADKFELAGPLANKLNSLTGKKGIGKAQFSNADIGELVKAFATTLRQNPNVDRRKRAKLFAQLILKGKKLKKLFGNVDESDLEEMFELIAEQLDGSPFFAQLLDDVCEETLKHAK